MIGKYVLNYEIDEIIEKGGMSTVYLGIHKYLKRKVAVKHLSPDLASKPENRKRFKNEAAQLAAFHHSNIVSLYDYVENDDGYFIITEYVEGRNLAEYIEEVSGPMPESKALNIMFQVLDAVGHMHDRNIIHRDIKSSNFIINQENEVKVIDFGIAKSLEYNQPLITQHGSKVGTTFFMSPQQVQGKVLDRRSDIYSLGVLLFHMLTGQYPYDHNMSEYEVYQKIINEALPDPREYYVGISDNIYGVIQKATAKSPLQRYQSCDEFKVALLNAQKRPKKKGDDATLGLRTRILEASDDIKKPLFSGNFFQNFLMLISTLFFITAIGLGLYFFTKKDVRHIVAGQVALRAGDSIRSETIEQLYYGETVRVLDDMQSAEQQEWLKVSSLRNSVGYIQQDYLAIRHVYDQINSILGNSLAQQIIPVEYKRALRKYFVVNRLFDNNASDWRLSVENKKSFEFNTIAVDDFNENGEDDFACVISHQFTGESQLVIFFDNLKENVMVAFDEPVKIKALKKGTVGGRWYLGNDSGGNETDNRNYVAKKYEYLNSNGILLSKTESNENIIYIYNPETRTLKAYSQTSH
jgi:serine/threonine protein kinase